MAEHGLSKSTYTWKMTGFSGLGAKKRYSDVFVVDGRKWRLLMFPKGNNADHMSLYLLVADSDSLPSGWSIPASFTFTVVNQLNEILSVLKSAEHSFHAKESGWGFKKLVPLSQLYGTPGFLVKDTCIVKAEVCVEKAKTEIAGDVTKEKSKLTQEESVAKKMGGEETQEVSENEKEKNAKQDKKETERGTINGTPAESGNRNSSETGTGTMSCLSSSVHAPSVVEPPHQLGKFAALFAEISEVLGTTAVNRDEVEVSQSLSLLNDVNQHEAEVSQSLSLLNEVSARPFFEISPSLRGEITSALEVLAQAKTLPSGQASSIRIFFNQFEDLCRSYDSSVAAIDTTQQFFDSKDGTFEILKRLNQSQLKIRNCINSIDMEKAQLERRLRELKESKSRLLEEYDTVGTEAHRAKAEWDGLLVQNAGMIELRGKAEKEKTRVEAMWNDFICVFKTE